MKNKKLLLRIAALIMAFTMAAVLASGCAKTDGAPEEGKAGEDAGKVTVVPSEPTEAPTQVPTQAPTEVPEPTETPEPTEKPDYSGGIVKDKASRYEFFGRKGQEAYCGTGHRLAVQFYATSTFNKIGFHSPTWTATTGYYVDYELYAWDKDYETTVFDNAPIAEAHYENFTDGAMCEMKVDDLPSGEYVLLALYGSTENMHNGGVWYDNDVEREDQISYLDDEVWYDRAIWLEIKYVNTPANKYGPLSDPGI